MSEPFRFKQFKINQDRCAMKIGTDGVLLGAWTNIKNADSILDIGAGTGVIALMLAQRSNAEVIDAIEIDSNAYEQCVENFESSLWGDRLYCYHAGLDEFIEEVEDVFLPFNELLEGVSALIAKNGIFSTIIPFKEKDDFIRMAATFDLFPSRCLQVKGNPASEVKRVLLEFSKQKKAFEVLDLTIEKERHVYTMEYVNLTKDFYIKM